MIVNESTLSSAAAKTSFHLSPSKERKTSSSASASKRRESFASIRGTSSKIQSSSSEEESYGRTDFGLESPTIVSNLIQIVRKDEKGCEMSQENIPPPRGFDEFQTLSSTKQNIELFKILSAIAEEIESLRQSTEKRFSLIENLVASQQSGGSSVRKGFYGLIPSPNVSNGQPRTNKSDTLIQARGQSKSPESGSVTRPASWPTDPQGVGSEEPHSTRDLEQLIAQNAQADKDVTLNVGGHRFIVSVSCLFTKFLFIYMFVYFFGKF